MPTNRPFLANFLAAFRAHSALQNTSVSPSTASPATYSTTTASPTHASSSATTSTSARALTTKTTPSVGVTTAAVQAAVAATATSHLSHHPHHRHPPTSTPIATPNPHNPAFGTRSRQRRGSDSSSEGGFRDALGNEKWYIGGRTAGGEERFYRLGMVRRERSGDRLSVDRLSL